MSLTFGLNSFMKYGKIILVHISVTSDASAAPQIGIIKQFKPILINAALRYIYFKYFCLFSHTIHAFLATPR